MRIQIDQPGEVHPINFIMLIENEEPEYSAVKIRYAEVMAVVVLLDCLGLDQGTFDLVLLDMRRKA